MAAADRAATAMAPAIHSTARAPKRNSTSQTWPQADHALAGLFVPSPNVTGPECTLVAETGQGSCRRRRYCAQGTKIGQLSVASHPARGSTHSPGAARLSGKAHRFVHRD